jgi:hypothetical protein
MTGQANREDFLNNLKRSSEVNITVRGRTTKRRFSSPVWFVLEGGKVTLVPIKGSESNWFKNQTKDPRIELGLNEISYSSNATLVRDSTQTKKALDKFKAKYKSEWSESYYTKRDAYVEVLL